jgi:hypothetical protein
MGADLPPNSSHLSFLRRAAADGLASATTVEAAKQIWEQVWRAAGRAIGGPAAGVGDDGEILCTWDRDEHHLEVEVREAEADWFYKNRQTRETAEWQTRATDSHLPTELVERIRILG